MKAFHERTYGPEYNPVKVGPKRDLVGDVTRAMRKKGIKIGLYYSLYEWYHPWYKTDIQCFVTQHFHPQFKDLVMRYAPDIIWTDGEWEQSSSVWKSPELLAWVFNHAPKCARSGQPGVDMEFQSPFVIELTTL